MPGEFDKYLNNIPEQDRQAIQNAKEQVQEVQSVKSTTGPSATPGQSTPQPEAASNQKLNPDIEKSINSIEKKDAPAFDQYDKPPPKGPEPKGPSPDDDLSR